MTVLIDPERAEQKHLYQLADFTKKRALEIGCGDGRLTWQYAGSAGRVTGIDLHADDLRVATIDCPADLRETVTFARADAIRLPFAKQAFDLAILAWSF